MSYSCLLLLTLASHELWNGECARLVRTEVCWDGGGGRRTVSTGRTTDRSPVHGGRVGPRPAVHGDAAVGGVLHVDHVQGLLLKDGPVAGGVLCPRPNTHRDAFGDLSLITSVYDAHFWIHVRFLHVSTVNICHVFSFCLYYKRNRYKINPYKNPRKMHQAV